MLVNVGDLVNTSLNGSYIIDVTLGHEFQILHQHFLRRYLLSLRKVELFSHLIRLRWLVRRKKIQSTVVAE